MATSETGGPSPPPSWRHVATRVANGIDVLNERIGRLISWLVPVMVATTFAVAILRYGFDVGWVWLQELYVWAHGAIIMVGMGYTLLHDGHVRVDIFYQSASPRTQAWINLLGVVFLLLPTAGVVFWVVYPYVSLSWFRLEISREAGGMPGLFLLKSTMIVFCIVLALQGLSLALRSLLKLADGNEADGGPEGATSHGGEG